MNEIVVSVMPSGWEGAIGGFQGAGGHSPRPGHPEAFAPPITMPPPTDWQASALMWVTVCTKAGNFILKDQRLSLIGSKVLAKESDAANPGLQNDHVRIRQIIPGSCSNTDHISYFINSSMVNFYNFIFTETLNEKAVPPTSRVA